MKWKIHDIVHAQCMQCEHACIILRFYCELSMYDLKELQHMRQLCMI